MDYQNWVSRAEAFLEAMRTFPGDLALTIERAPPLTLSELNRIQSNWHRHLPAELARFWTEGSAHLNCRYGWNVPPEDLSLLQEVFEYQNGLCGGPRFISASEIDPEPMETSYFDGDI